MTSMSVKNRVAMFEHTGNKNDEDVNPLSPSGRSFKRPTTPSGQTFKKATTPNSQAFKSPLTPNGQSFLRPTTPTAKTFERSTVSASSPREKIPAAKPFDRASATVSASSPRDKRASWAWPAEESVIPVPQKEHVSSNEDNRRYSSPFLSQSNAPVILPQKSPKPKPLVHSTPFILPQKSPNSKSKIESTPLKHIQNQDSNGASLPRKTLSSPVHALQHRFEVDASKPVIMTQPRAQSPVTSLAKSSSIDENKAPRTNDTKPRNKALKLAKTRNSTGSSLTKVSWPPSGTGLCKEKHSVSEDAVDQDRNNEESSMSSSNSSNTNNELSNIATKADSMERVESSAYSMTSLKDLRPPASNAGDVTQSSQAKISTLDARALAEKQGNRVTRAGKLSQTPRRASTPESTSEYSNEVSMPDSKASSESAVPAVRGTRTVSKVSHQEARKALLHAAQKKKEKADAERQVHEQGHEKQEMVSFKVEGEKHPESISSKNAAGRLALKAANVLAIKNSSKPHFGDLTIFKPDEAHDATGSLKEFEGSTNGSVASGCSDQKRRKNHPAFAARGASPRTISQQVDSSLQISSMDTGIDKASTKPGGSAKPFSEELFSSFRYFQETRPEITLQPIASKCNSVSCVCTFLPSLTSSLFQ